MEMRCRVEGCGTAGDEYFMLNGEHEVYCQGHRPAGCCKGCFQEYETVNEDGLCGWCAMFGLPTTMQGDSGNDYLQWTV